MPNHIHCPDCGDAIPEGTDLHKCTHGPKVLMAGLLFHSNLKRDMSYGLGRSADQVTLGVSTPTTETAKRCLNHARLALDLFVERNKKYGESANRLGMRGQYADINRKVVLLERWIWDGVEPEGSEGIVEVCEDLIGHLLLTIDQFLENGGVVK